MRLRNVVTPSLAVLAVLAVHAGPAGAAAQPRIVGGSPPPGPVPYQVALVAHVKAIPHDGQFCGGSILDSTHVITAAHCVFDTFRRGEALGPGDVDVVAGKSDLSTDAGGQRVGVVGAVFMPGFDPLRGSNDAAVVTVDPPLTLDGTTKKKIVPVTHTQESYLDPPNTALVSGWGATTDGSQETSPTLLSATVNFVDSPTCQNDYAQDGDALTNIDATMVCASAPGKDSCHGDSGGPLAVDDPNAVGNVLLAGIVSWGNGCADPSYPGVYTRLSNLAVEDFVASPPAGWPPSEAAAPQISGTAVVGSVLTCSAPVVAGTRDGYRWTVTFPSGEVYWATDLRPSATYTVIPDAAGGRLQCLVQTSNAAGYRWDESPLTAVVPGPAAPPPTSDPAPLPNVPVTPIQSPQDTTAPVARIVAASCSKRWFCVLRVQVTDAGFSTGIRALDVRVTSRYRSTCRRGGKRVRCTRTRTRTLRASRTGVVTFRVLASDLPVGTHRFTVFATDNAGHRQVLPAVTTLRTKAAAKRRGG
jgi:hypothetical protein